MTTERESLTQDILKELLHYNPETGVFRWLERGRKWFKTERAFGIWNTRWPDKIAGSIYSTGYRSITLLGRRHLAQRLVFLYIIGQFPEDQTDHINGDKDNNRWGNLRAVTHQENMKNKEIPKNNKSGRIGVCWHKAANKWQSRINVEGVNISLGVFDKFEDAEKSRQDAEVKYGFHKNHGRRPLQKIP